MKYFLIITLGITFCWPLANQWEYGQRSMASSESCIFLINKILTNDFAIKTQWRLSKNDFMTSRTLGIELFNKGAREDEAYLRSYSRYFGPNFKQQIGNLKAHEHWLDAGSGDGDAILEYYKLGGKARTTGVVFEETNIYRQQAQQFPSQNRNFSGRLIEDIPNKELGKVNILTDFYGPLSYTKELDTILTKYLELLAPNGSIHTHFTDIMTTIYHKKKELTLIEFLELIPGLTIQRHYFSEYNPYLFSIQITKKINYKAENIPKLKLQLYIDEAPMRRDFVIESMNETFKRKLQEIIAPEI